MAKEQTSIVFTGDIGFDRYMDHRWEDEALLSEDVLRFIHSAEHCCANVEGALINAEDDGKHGIFFHSMNPDAICVLQKMKADLWCIGNNHSMDAGGEGLMSTLAHAKALGCKTIGAGENLDGASEPVILNEAGGIGIIGVSYQPDCTPATASEPGNFSWSDFDTLSKRIACVKQHCRWCIVVVHGGEEFTCMPLPYTRERYLKFLELGADIVVGHHPHVPENYEMVGEQKAIFYSLGNFIFDTDYQRAHLYTDIGILLKLNFTPERFSFDAIGTRIERGSEHIVAAPVPEIFTNVSAEEYALLAPLATKSFIAEEKRRMIFMEPETYTNASDETWDAHFYDKDYESLDPGAHMDFTCIIPVAQAADEEAWKKSKLPTVQAHIQTLL